MNRHVAHIFIFLALLFHSNLFLAQDTLILRSGDRIVACNLIEKENRISYTECGKHEGPKYFVHAKEVAQIRYLNGMVRDLKIRKLSGDYYLPFVPSEPEHVSKLAFYLSGGAGKGIAGSWGGIGTSLSASIAYKSHVLSGTHGNIFEFGAVGGGADPFFRSQYSGILLGEAARFRYGFICVSVGIASTNLTAYRRDNTFNGFNYSYAGISFPLELKLFVHTGNVIGIGATISNNFVPASGYNQTTLCASLVFGMWNKTD